MIVTRNMIVTRTNRPVDPFSSEDFWRIYFPDNQVTSSYYNLYILTFRSGRFYVHRVMVVSLVRKSILLATRCQVCLSILNFYQTFTYFLYNLQRYNLLFFV